MILYGICLSCWSTSLSMIISKSVYVDANNIISFFFYGWVIFMKKSVNHSVVSDSVWLKGLQPVRLLCSWFSPGKTAGVGGHSLLLGVAFMYIYENAAPHHPLVDGQLGCLHVLAIVNSASVNIGGACIFLNYSFVWIYGLWIIWQLFLKFFWGNSILFSIMAAPICIPTNSVGELVPFSLHPL